MFLSTMCLDPIYSKEGNAQSLNSGQSPWNQLEILLQYPKISLGSKQKKHNIKTKTKKNDEKLQNLDLLEGGLKGRVSYPKVE